MGHEVENISGIIRLRPLQIIRGIRGKKLLNVKQKQEPMLIARERRFTLLFAMIIISCIYYVEQNWINLGDNWKGKKDNKCIMLKQISDRSTGFLVIFYFSTRKLGITLPKAKKPWPKSTYEICFLEIFTQIMKVFNLNYPKILKNLYLWNLKVICLITPSKNYFKHEFFSNTSYPTGATFNMGM